VASHDAKDLISNPKVFISYAWSEIRREMVLDIGKRLQQDGVEVVLDLWDLKEGDDRFHFMERSVSELSITKVLVFSDRLYSEKADRRDRGVGIETQILTPELYSKITDSKIIPISCEINEEGEAWMPVYLKSRFYIDFRDEARVADNYERLVRLIYDKPEHKKPPLGEPPHYIVEPDAVPRRSYTRFLSSKQAAFRNSPSVTSAESTYLTELYREIPSYYLEPDAAASNYDALIRALRALVPMRNELLEIFIAMVTEDPDRGAERIAGVLERIVKLKFRPEDVNVWEPLRIEPIGLFCWDLFLHTGARMISLGHYPIAATLLARRWAVPETDPSRAFSATTTFKLFYFHSAILSFHNEHAQTRYLNYQAVVLKDLLSEENGLSFEELRQADIILSIRSYLSRTDPWFSNLLRYSDNRPSVPLFHRAEEHHGFRDLATILGIESKTELRMTPDQTGNPWWTGPSQALNLLDIAKLDTR
jgi:hypothetical protein